MKRILYVEDDTINALVMQKLLSAHYEFIHVENGESCLKLFSNQMFHMVLMDINLGKDRMDGVETMKHLKERYPTLPVLAVTSYAMPEDEDRFLKSGFNGYIAKPIDRQELLEYIAHFFS